MPLPPGALGRTDAVSNVGGDAANAVAMARAAIGIFTNMEDMTGDRPHNYIILNGAAAEAADLRE